MLSPSVFTCPPDFVNGGRLTENFPAASFPARGKFVGLAQIRLRQNESRPEGKGVPGGYEGWGFFGPREAQFAPLVLNNRVSYRNRLVKNQVYRESFFNFGTMCTLGARNVNITI